MWGVRQSSTLCLLLVTAEGSYVQGVRVDIVSKYPHPLLLLVDDQYVIKDIMVEGDPVERRQYLTEILDSYIYCTGGQVLTLEALQVYDPAMMLLDDEVAITIYEKTFGLAFRRHPIKAIERTHLPEVYTVYDDKTQTWSTAFIPNLAVAQTMLEWYRRFATTTLYLPCRYHPTKQRWIPTF